MMQQEQVKFVVVRYPDGRIAFRYDPVRGIVELQDRRHKYYFDLTQIIVNYPIDKSTNMCYDNS